MTDKQEEYEESILSRYVNVMNQLSNPSISSKEWNALHHQAIVLECTARRYDRDICGEYPEKEGSLTSRLLEKEIKSSEPVPREKERKQEPKKQSLLGRIFNKPWKRRLGIGSLTLLTLIAGSYAIFHERKIDSFEETRKDYFEETGELFSKEVSDVDVYQVLFSGYHIKERTTGCHAEWRNACPGLVYPSDPRVLVEYWDVNGDSLPDKMSIKREGDPKKYVIIGNDISPIHNKKFKNYLDRLGSEKNQVMRICE